MFQPVGQNPQCERFGFCGSFLGGGAIGEHTRQFGHSGQLAAVHFLLKLQCALHFLT